jgi:hypothetical protein
MDGIDINGFMDCKWFLCQKGENGKPRRFKPNPKKSDHKYCCSSCRVAAWNFNSAGAKVITKMQLEFDELKKRVEALEKSEALNHSTYR